MSIFARYLRRTGTALKTILSYLTLYVVWSSTYLAIKYAVQGFEPFTVVGIRFFVGGLALSGYAWASGRFRTPLSRPQITNALIIGALLLLGGNGLVTLAQKRVDSYIAALIISSTPMFVVAWDLVILRKRVSLIALIGVLCGIAGVAVLLYRPSGDPVRFSAYVWLVLAAVAFWALGTSLSKRLALPKDPVILTCIQQVSCGALCLVAAGCSGGIPSAVPPLVSVAAVAYLTVFGSVSLVAYTYLVQHEPNERAVSYAFVNPLGAILLGVVVAGEKAVPGLAPGVVLILSGLGLVFYGQKVLTVVLRRVREKRAG